MFPETTKRYLISKDEDADIRIGGDWSGVVMFVEDIGWIIKSDMKESKERDKFYGVFIKVRNLQDKKKYKLYEGMRFVIQTNMFEVSSIK